MTPKTLNTIPNSINPIMFFQKARKLKYAKTAKKALSEEVGQTWAKTNKGEKNNGNKHKPNR